MNSKIHGGWVCKLLNAKLKFMIKINELKSIQKQD